VKFVVTTGEASETVEVTGQGGRYRVTIGGQVWEVDARRTRDGAYSLLIDGVSCRADVGEEAGARVVEVGGERHVLQVEEAIRHRVRTRGAAVADGGQTVAAPMPGKVTQVAVSPGDRVKAGDTLVVIEAMKMENELKAAGPGTVAEIRVATGQPVNAGDVLVVIARAAAP
jgi:biotin carboxyl carrier protein